jgi:hypothetical protein
MNFEPDFPHIRDQKNWFVFSIHNDYNMIKDKFKLT